METPNLNKLHEHINDINTCREFMEWFLTKHTVFKTSDSPDPVYIGAGDYIEIDKTIYEFFGIQSDKLETERIALTELVKSNLPKWIDVTNNADYADNSHKISGAKLFKCNRDDAHEYVSKHCPASRKINNEIDDDKHIISTTWWLNNKTKIAVYDYKEMILAVYVNKR